MTFRIGGEIEIAPDFMGGPELNSMQSLPKPNVAKLNTGRSALHVALQEIIRRGGKRKAWLPSYICSSVVTVFGILNFEVNYYAVGSNLCDQKFPEFVARGETFLYVHYFGRKNTEAVEWLDRVYSAGDFFVIEDCVQASLNSNVGDNGNYAITSFRKFLPQPDGALLGADFPVEIDLSEPDEAFISAKFLGKLLRYQSSNEALYLPLFSESESRIEHDASPRRMSWLSEFIMNKTNIPDASEKRRGNWQSLSNTFKSNPSIQRILSPIYNKLDDGEVPLGFPVTVVGGKRDALRLHLADGRIYCPVHWGVPHLHNSNKWQEEKALSRSILTLPIDQRLGEEQMRYMVQQINIFEEKN